MQAGATHPSPVCTRCGSPWGTDLTCSRCATPAGAPRPLTASGPFGPGWDGLNPAWKAAFADGYTPEDLEPFFADVARATGIDLVCVWDRLQDGVLSGDSCWYVVDTDAPVTLRDLTGNLWAWASDPDFTGTPGDPDDWRGELATFSRPVGWAGAGSHNAYLSPTDPTDGVNIVWADENGRFALHGGTRGNPGCDECGSADAVASIDGVYACLSDLHTRGIPLPDAFHCFECGNDYAYQFAGACRACRNVRTCAECGKGMRIEETEVSHHLFEDSDEIDYDTDADHVAVDDYEYGAHPGRCAKCGGDISDYAPDITLCVWCEGVSED